MWSDFWFAESDEVVRRSDVFPSGQYRSATSAVPVVWTHTVASVRSAYPSIGPERIGGPGTGRLGSGEQRGCGEERREKEKLSH